MPDKKISDLEEATQSELNGNTSVPVTVEEGGTGSNVTKRTTIAELRSAASSAGGSDHQVQYNNNGALAGSADLTYDGSSLSVKNLILPVINNEGGQMIIQAPASSTLANDKVAIDVVDNMFRVFENGGNFRCASIDITKCEPILPSGNLAGTDLLKKAVVDTTAPAHKNDGDLWFDTATSSLHVYVESLSAWVQT